MLDTVAYNNAMKTMGLAEDDDNQFSPYSSKAVSFHYMSSNVLLTQRRKMYVTMLLFNSPRLRFSAALERATLGWAKIMGVKDVPSPYALKKERERLKELVGNPTLRQVSGTGDVYFLNDIAAALAKVHSRYLIKYSTHEGTSQFPRTCRIPCCVRACNYFPRMAETGDLNYGMERNG